MPFLDEFRYCPNELAKTDAERFGKRLRDIWDNNGEYMSRDLAQYMSKAPSPVTCRKYMNGGSEDAKYKTIRAIEHAIELKLSAQKITALRDEIAANEAKNAVLQARLDAM